MAYDKHRQSILVELLRISPSSLVCSKALDLKPISVFLPSTWSRRPRLRSGAGDLQAACRRQWRSRVPPHDSVELPQAFAFSSRLWTSSRSPCYCQATWYVGPGWRIKAGDLQAGCSRQWRSSDPPHERRKLHGFRPQAVLRATLIWRRRSPWFSSWSCMTRWWSTTSTPSKRSGCSAPRNSSRTRASSAPDAQFPKAHELLFFEYRDCEQLYE